MSARVAVDWTRCDGHGLCAALAPEVLGRDPWGFPLIRRDVEVDDVTARRIVAVCPALALREER